MTKHLTKVKDLTKEDYSEIFRITDRLEKMEDNTNLCRGKVLAFAFLKESTRTLAAFQSAIVKLGGGWMGLTTKKGTYLETGEEDAEDTLTSLAELGDLIVIRADGVDLEQLKKKIKVPIINALGADEHTVIAVGVGYYLKRNFGDLAKVKLGFYGMSGASRPAIASCRLLSFWGTKVFEDPVVPGLGFSDELKKEFTRDGLRLKSTPLEEFINKVDLLLVWEGLPRAGTPANLVEKFNKRVKIIGSKDAARLKKNAFVYAIEPRFLTDGRCTIDKSLELTEKYLPMMPDFLKGIMGSIVYLLKVKV